MLIVFGIVAVSTLALAWKYRGSFTGHSKPSSKLGKVLGRVLTKQ